VAQDNWRWCNKCEGLAFAGNATQGPCPAGGRHDHSGSANYSLLKDVSVPIPYGQDNWRWCRKCEGLAFSGNGEPGACPASGTHDHRESGDYQLLQNLPHPILPTYQENWRWCHKCQGLYFAGGSGQGSCPFDGTHEQSGSGNYALHEG
jgi:hypothetical protein